MASFNVTKMGLAKSLNLRRSWLGEKTTNFKKAHVRIGKYLFTLQYF
ncbi:unnamed protein product [Ixodes persulcatus]